MKAGTLILRGNCPRQLRRGVGEYPQRIVQALECLDAEDGMPGQRREALPQRQQMGREILSNTLFIFFSKLFLLQKK